MPNKVLSNCPVCGGKLHISKLSCPTCHTEITGDFATSGLQKLSQDELLFAETFIRVQGNIKEMEKVFNVSYPTIKKQLDNVIQKLGGPCVVTVEPIISHDEILTKIKEGKISVDEAVALMKGE